MAIALAMIPAGFSAETKKEFIRETKLALAKGFKFHPRAASVWLQEFDPDMMCEDAAKKRVLFVYTGAGKPEDEKAEIGKLWDEACAKCFGDKKGDSFVIFKQHTLDQVAARGKLKSLDTTQVVVPTFEDYLNGMK